MENFIFYAVQMRYKHEKKFWILQFHSRTKCCDILISRLSRKRIFRGILIPQILRLNRKNIQISFC